LSRKLAALQSRQCEVEAESTLLAGILAELTTQLDASRVPKHILIAKSGELIRMLKELQMKPSPHLLLGMATH
jgi:hypothetical protein